MKTVSKINPEEEYQNAKKLIELASKQVLDENNLTSLDSSVDNLITAARVLMEREERRRGHSKIPHESSKPKGRSKGEEREDSKKLPSQKFPNLEIEEETIPTLNIPICGCCGKSMSESGLYDVTEKLEVKPKKYFIKRSKRPIFNCSNCHGSMVNTPTQPSIIPLSNYGDSTIVDVILSKYLDLLPIERYVQIAYRSGINGDLPTQSLIGLTHQGADFLMPVYDKIKKETQSSRVLLGDETPHKMLEGDKRSNWYLWGFFSETACFFEAHDTRSGDVIFNLLKVSQTKYLVSDGYSGYHKAVKKMKLQFNKEIIEVNCNAHAFRHFKDASITWKEESKPFLELYNSIYEIERERKKVKDKLTLIQQLELRQKMLPLFEQLKNKCIDEKKRAMAKSGLMKAIDYFLNHYDRLIICTTNIDIPLDTNLAERELRAPVIGRKTWLGSHSKRGAMTNAILFSIVSSCKINNINPRNYFPWIIDRIHKGEEILTPYEYASKLFII